MTFDEKQPQGEKSPLFSSQEIMHLDQQHVWHPYAPTPAVLPSYPIASAAGSLLTLTDGRVLVDGMSSWWAAIHGYSHPTLVEAATKQLQTMSHVMFGGLTHPPAVQLAQRLVNMCHEASPVNTVQEEYLNKVFYCDSGSVAVEVALKMALQYWIHKQGVETERHQFLTVRGGYHGDTFHPMSVCDPVNGMHHEYFAKSLPVRLYADKPQTRFDEDWNESDIDSLRHTLKAHGDSIAAVILEPIVQGAGGMHFYHPTYLKRVRELCNEYGVLLILDEIATGFGRTGEMFAFEHACILPDILCLGKALSGGMMSFAATMTNQKVASAFGPDAPGVLMHGPTFMGNPLACAVSLASLDLLLQSDFKPKVHAIQEQLREELNPCRSLPTVKDVRVLGAIGVVEMKEPLPMKIAQPALVDQGVWLRPFGRLLYTMPPFLSITSKELSQITSAMVSLAKRRF